MARNRYVALIRGINVGGRNPVAMSDLRTALEDAGYESVSTYIASGNVLFETGRSRGSLEHDIETVLERRFGVPLVVVVRSRQEMRNIVDKAPEGFGSRPATYHSDAIFLRSPLTVRQAMSAIDLREGVDQAWPGKGVVYFARLSSRRVQSRLSKVAGTPEYKLMTIRSWSTTTKLRGLLDK